MGDPGAGSAVERPGAGGGEVQLSRDCDSPQRLLGPPGFGDGRDVCGQCIPECGGVGLGGAAPTVVSSTSGQETSEVCGA